MKERPRRVTTRVLIPVGLGLLVGTLAHACGGGGGGGGDRTPAPTTLIWNEGSWDTLAWN